MIGYLAALLIGLEVGTVAGLYLAACAVDGGWLSWEEWLG